MLTSYNAAVIDLIMRSIVTSIGTEFLPAAVKSAASVSSCIIVPTSAGSFAVASPQMTCVCEATAVIRGHWKLPPMVVAAIK